MSTRSFIGMKDGDTYKGIYCHFDGYVQNGVGQMLLEHYQDINKVRQLMNLGDLSYLGTEPKSDPKFWKEYQKRDETYCRSYRDRGDSSVDALTFKNKEDFLDTARRLADGYVYLFKDNKWHIYIDVYSGFQPLICPDKD